MGYLYILKFDTGRFYIGSTADLERRLKQHSSGHTHSTKRLGSTFTLVFSQELETLQQARRLEHKIKAWKRKEFIEKIVREGFI